MQQIPDKVWSARKQLGMDQRTGAASDQRMGDSLTLGREVFSQYDGRVAGKFAAILCGRPDVQMGRCSFGAMCSTMANR
jgi:hypothetical protein